MTSNSSAEDLAECLGESAAAALEQWAAGRDKNVQLAHPRWTASGYTGSKLAAIQISRRHPAGSQPERIVVKVCPPGPYAHEGGRHTEAMSVSPSDFAERHLVDMPYGPYPIRDGGLLMFQSIAGGSLLRSKPISELTETERADACVAVISGVLKEWNGADFKISEAPVPASAYLRKELRDAFDEGGSVRRWAAAASLLDPVVRQIITAEDGLDRPLVNPVLMAADESVSPARLIYIAGRTHGDLHQENALIPRAPDGTLKPDDFRLVDLSTFDANAPLSRDPTMLILSIISSEVASLPARQSDPLLDYLVTSEPKATTSLTPLMLRTVDAVRSAVESSVFFTSGWEDNWQGQYLLSLQATALLFTTFSNLPVKARWWFFRLAARAATQSLSAPGPLETQPSRLVDPSILGRAGITSATLVHPSTAGQPAAAAPDVNVAVSEQPAGTAEESEHWNLRGDKDFRTHWLPRARGVEPDAETNGWYFTGRHLALRELADWLCSSLGEGRDRRIRIVMGPPGSGKSALIAHLLVLADPQLRDEAPDIYKRDLPRELVGSVGVAVHARDKDVYAVVTEIAAAANVPASTPVELIVALSGRRLPLTIVVDALDEAAPDHIEPIARLLNRLARDADDVGIRVVVAVRDALEDSPLGSAVRQLGTRRVTIRVNKEPYLAGEDVTDYVRRRLLLEGHFADASPQGPGTSARTPYRDDPRLAARVARAVAQRSRGNFLVAQLVSRFLAEDSAPVDVSREGWSAQFPETVEAALNEYFARFGSLERQRWARDLLTPLAFVSGWGLPDNELWASLASALSRPTKTYAVDDVHELMDTAAAYLVDRSTGRDRHTYRLYHTAMDQYLRDRCRVANADTVVTQTLLSCVPPGRDGMVDWRTADPYLLTHLAGHAAKAGAEQLEELVADPAFLIFAAPATLVRVLSAAPSTIRAIVRVYQVAAHRLGDDAGERAAYLAMVARQLGEISLAGRLEDVSVPASWRVTACEWTPLDDYQVLMTLGASTTTAALASSRPGNVLVISGDSSGHVELHRWADGIAESDDPHQGHGAAVTAIAVTPAPNGSMVVLTGGRDGSLRLWHIDDDLLIPGPSVLPGAHEAEVTSVAFGAGPAGHELAVSADRSGGLRLWQTAVERPVSSWSAVTNGDRVTAVAVCRDTSGRSQIVTGTVDGRAQLWRPGSGSAPDAGTLMLRSAANLSIGAIVLHATGDHMVALIATGFGVLHRMWLNANSDHPQTDARLGIGGISALAVGVGPPAHEEMVAVGSVDGEVALLRGEQGGILEGDLVMHRRVRAHEGRLRVILLAADARGAPLMVSYGDDRKIVSWSAQSGSPPGPERRPRHGSDVTLAAICGTPDGHPLCLIAREVPADPRAAFEFWTVLDGVFLDLTRPETRDTGTAPRGQVVTSTFGPGGMITTQRPSGPQSGPMRAIPLRPHCALAAASTGGVIIVATATTTGKLQLHQVEVPAWTAHSLGDEHVRSLGQQHQGQPWIDSLTIGQYNVHELLLATGGTEGTLDLWKIQNDGLARLMQPESLTAAGPRLGFVQAPGGLVNLVAGDSQGVLRLLSIVRDRLVPAGEPWHAHDQPITAVAAISENGGPILATAGDLSGRVTQWHVGDPASPPRLVAQVQLGSQVVGIVFTDLHNSVVWCKQGAVVIRWDKAASTRGEAPANDSGFPPAALAAGPGGDGPAPSVSAGQAMLDADAVTGTIVAHAGLSYSEQARELICSALENDWHAVAALVGAARTVRDGWSLWDWMESNRKLHRLRGALVTLGRNDLVALLDADVTNNVAATLGAVELASFRQASDSLVGKAGDLWEGVRRAAAATSPEDLVALATGPRHLAYELQRAIAALPSLDENPNYTLRWRTAWQEACGSASVALRHLLVTLPATTKAARKALKRMPSLLTHAESVEDAVKSLHALLRQSHSQ